MPTKDYLIFDPGANPIKLFWSKFTQSIFKLDRFIIYPIFLVTLKWSSFLKMVVNFIAKHFTVLAYLGIIKHFTVVINFVP
jgi:hypothetical protein